MRYLRLHRVPAPTSIPTFQSTLRWEQLICPRVLDLVSCKQGLSMKGLIIDSMAHLDLSLATVFSYLLKPLLLLKQIAFFSPRESIIPPILPRVLWPELHLALAGMSREQIKFFIHCFRNKQYLFTLRPYKWALAEQVQ